MANVGYHLETAWLQKPPLGVQLKSGHPLTDGLVGCWLFNEAGGDMVYDLSGYGNHGTLEGMAFPPTATSGWNPGKDGVAINFDGSSDYIECGKNSSLDMTNTMTVETWIKLTTSQNASIVRKYVGGGDPGYYLMAAAPLGVDQYTFIVYTSAGSAETTVVKAFELNEWVHLVGVWDGYSSLYYNGVYLGTGVATKSGTTAHDTPFYISGHKGTSDFFPGTIHLTRIYNRALSASEIQELYMYPYAMFEPVSTYALLPFAAPQSNLAAMAMVR